jgi:hypothetical protein
VAKRNVDIVRSAVKAFNRGDVEAVLAVASATAESPLPAPPAP